MIINLEEVLITSLSTGGSGSDDRLTENVTIDTPEESQGKVMEEMGLRKGDLTTMVPDGKGRTQTGKAGGEIIHRITLQSSS